MGTSTNHLCDSCLIGYAPDSTVTKNCIFSCSSPNKWYYNTNNRKVCLNGSSCPSTDNILVESTYQCVESCKSSGTCELCKSQSLYSENNKCVSSCSSGSTKNDATHTCDSAIQEENGCTTTIKSEKELILNETGITSKFETEVSNYILTNDAKNVRLIKNRKASYLVYQNETCGYDAAIKYNFAFTNMTLCINKLKQKGLITETDKIIISQIDIVRQVETTNQAGYYITKADGTKID